MLSDSAIRNAKPADKAFKLADEKGLFLLVAPSGGKWWRLKYRFGGKEKLLSLGTYPEVGLKAARNRRDEARKLLAGGGDPGEHRKTTRAAVLEPGPDAGPDFNMLANEWYGKFSPTWSETYSKHTWARLERDVLPWIGQRPIAELAAPELLAVLERVESRGKIDTAHRLLQLFGQIFRFAERTGRVERDPSASLRGALAPNRRQHRAALVDPQAVGQLLRDIDTFEGSFVVKCALRLAPLVFVRPGELCRAEWLEIDWDTATWSIPGPKLKMRNDHIVPLSRQAIEVLREIQPLTGHGRYVFPSARTPGGSRCLTTEGFLAALRRMGYGSGQMDAHGFRAMARTLLDEQLGFSAHLIEHQLAHAVRDPLGRAYNRTQHLPERRTMMQTWADYLDGLKKTANVITLRKSA